MPRIGCSMLRLVVLMTVTSSLAACATGRFDGGGCPPVPAYSREFLARAAGELQRLPHGAAVEQILADYQVMRDQARACSGLR
jgi:hypothetical protein